MSDWWSKKLAGEKPTPPRTSLPPTQAPINFPQVQTVPPAQHAAQHAPQQTTSEAQSLSEYLKSSSTKGGEATRRETSTCPACGGRYVFSRGKPGSMSPAPRCYECGWNGMYEQADQSSWS